MSDNWHEYVRRFYSLSPSEQKNEWAKLTPDQRARFEAARASLPVGPTSTPGSKGRLLSCTIVVAVGVAIIIGLFILGVQVDRDDDSQVRPPEVKVEPEATTPKRAAAEVDLLRKDDTQSIAALRKAQLLIE